MQEEIKSIINWPDVFVRYEQSGVNQKQFCEHEGLAFCQFKYHRTNYLKQKVKKTGFARIRMKPSDRYEMELGLSQGLCLKFNTGISPSYIKQLLQALR